MSENKVNLILKDGKENQHENVVKNFLMLDEKDKSNEMVMLAYADSLYELGNDVVSLDAYLAFVMKHPKSKAVDVALLGAAMALKNLDLQEEAMHFLQLINPEHHGLNQEIEHSHKILSEQAKARAILGRFNPRNAPN